MPPGAANAALHLLLRLWRFDREGACQRRLERAAVLQRQCDSIVVLDLLDLFHLTSVWVRKIVKQFHFFKALYPNFVATTRIEMGIFPSNAVGFFSLG